MFTNYIKNAKWKNLAQTLVSENCLTFGQNSRLTSKNLTKYLLGTRGTIEIFKLYEMRYLLLKIYPLIQTLFYNPRANLQLAFKKLKNYETKSKPMKNKNHLYVKKPFFKKEPSFHIKPKNVPPQVLFATITPAFASIISQAAQTCSMPYHQKRWLNGSVTGALAYLFDIKRWANARNYTQRETSYFFRKQWSKNKENWAKSKEKAWYYNYSRWPSLVVIPDISNNSMVLTEIKKVGLPVIGLVNSNCNFEIEYPIFAQDQSFSSVHFFCHFLATLIAKEMVYTQHKSYTKKRSLVKKKINFSATEQKDLVIFPKFVLQPKIKDPRKKPFFFNCFLPAQKKIENRASLSRNLLVHPYKFFVEKKKIQKQEKWIKRRHKKDNYSARKHKQGLTKVWLRAFKRMQMYWRRSQLDFSLNAGFKNIWQLRQQILEKPYLLSTATLLKTEEKKKYLRNQRQHFIFSSEKYYITNKLLQNFIWISSKMRMFWKYKKFSPNERVLVPTIYYWTSLEHFSNDIKWRAYKHLLPTIVNVYHQWKKRVHKKWKQNKYRRLMGDKKKHKRHLHAVGSSKKKWKTWVDKTTKHYPRKYKTFK